MKVLVQGSKRCNILAVTKRLKTVNTGRGVHKTFDKFLILSCLMKQREWKSHIHAKNTPYISELDFCAELVVVEGEKKLPETPQNT